ncbi:hypothetical protein D3C76_1784870 [compost metagenome]
MAFDVSLLALEAIFKKARRTTLAFWLGPFLFLVVMQPQNLIEIRQFGEWISYVGIGLGMIYPTLLLLLSIMRGVKGRA